MLDGLEGEERGKRGAELLTTPKQGLLKMLRRDFHRTAARNLVNRGISKLVSMKITGHKTRSDLGRYHIARPPTFRKPNENSWARLKARYQKQIRGRFRNPLI